MSLDEGQTEAANHKLSALRAFAQDLMNVGIEISGQSNVEVGDKWARDPKVIALALLCRTLGHLKGATSLLEQRLLVEASVIVRCCVENLICVGALRQKGDDFVVELLHAVSAGSRKLANLALEALSGGEPSETVIRLEEIVRSQKKTASQAKPLNTKALSKGNPVGSSYILFSVLSEQAAHVSARSLGRHLEQQQERGNRFIHLEIAPTPTDEQLQGSLLDLLRTVLGVVVGVNEILGGTEPGNRLTILACEFEVIAQK
jgi:hypothetical protein